MSSIGGGWAGGNSAFSSALGLAYDRLYRKEGGVRPVELRHNQREKDKKRLLPSLLNQQGR